MHIPPVAPPARFRNILVASVGPGGESPSQLESAAWLAECDGAEIALDEWTMSSSDDGAAVQSAPLRRAHQIIRRATTGRHDLVVVAPGPSADSRRAVQELTTHCPTALLAVKAAMTSGDVVVLVDPLDRVEVNRAAVVEACAHARRTNGTAHVLAAAPRRGVTSPAAQHLALADVVERVGVDVRHELHVATLSPTVAAARLADMVQAPLIVVGATARGGVGGMSIAAHQLASSSKHSLLVARPATFDGDALRAAGRARTPSAALDVAEMAYAS